MAQEEEFTSTHIASKPLEINLKLPVYKVKSILTQPTSEVLRHMEIGMINRRLHQYSITWLCEAIDDKCNTRNYARYKIEPLGLYAPTITVLLPSYDRRSPTRRTHRVTQYLVLQPVAQLIKDERRSSKIHISHPKRHQVTAPPNGGHSINLQGIGISTVYKDIKVVLHNIF